MRIPKKVLVLFFVALILMAAVPLTVSNFTQVHIDRKPQGGTATPRLLVDNLDGPSQVVVFKTAGTPVWTLNDGGGLIYTGSQEYLNISAPTAIATTQPALKVNNAGVSNQFELQEAATPIALVQGWGAITVTTTTTKHIWEIVDSSPVMTAGTNIYSAINLDLAIGNSTAGTNDVYGFLVDDISGDAQVTETVFDIAGTGWDVGFSAGGNKIDLDADDDTSITADTDDTIHFEVSGSDVLTITATGLDTSGTILYGANNTYPLGYASSAQQIACVSATITGTASVTVTGVTTPTFGIATLVTDPGTGAGDPAMVTFDAPTTTTLQVNVWQDDFTTAATVVATVHVCAIGDE